MRRILNFPLLLDGHASIKVDRPDLAVIVEERVTESRHPRYWDVLAVRACTAWHDILKEGAECNCLFADPEGIPACSIAPFCTSPFMNHELEWIPVGETYASRSKIDPAFPPRGPSTPLFGRDNVRCSRHEDPQYST